MTTVALLRTLSCVFADPAVQVTFTTPGEDRSPFADSLEEWLLAQGLRCLPWDQAQRGDFDLAVAASYVGAPLAMSIPVLYMPHGYGRTREPREHAFAPQGQPVDGIHLTPSSHSSAFVPPWGESAVVGDPIYDDLTHLRGARSTIRGALDIGDRKLIVLSSTWSSQSLFGQFPGLFGNLCAQLPSDEFAVAAIVHPNVRVRHGEWQTRVWLTDALSRGMLLSPAGAEWRAILAAADMTIGDHGAVTFYADLLGLPVLRASGHTGELTPGTVLNRSVTASARLRVHASLEAQLRIATPPEPHALAALRRDAVEFPGESIARIRRIAYNLLGLSVPSGPPPWAGLPDALGSLETKTPDIYRCQAIRHDGDFVCVERRPGLADSADEAVLVAPFGRSAALQSATVITVVDRTPDPSSVLQEFPGCQAVSTAHDGFATFVSRDGPSMTFRGLPGEHRWLAALATVLLSPDKPHRDAITIQLGHDAAQVEKTERPT